MTRRKKTATAIYAVPQYIIPPQIPRPAEQPRHASAKLASTPYFFKNKPQIFSKPSCTPPKIII
jgi:hypothetical protein